MYFVNIFTYKEDENIVGMAAKSAKKVFGDDCEINVIDDSLKPISKRVITQLQKDGVLYRTSTFDRKHNLNGKECCLGLISEFIKSANGRDGITIKLDSDTLILKKGLFTAIKGADYIKYSAAHRPGSIFSGVCYIIKNEILGRMLDMLSKIDLHSKTAPEDMVIGCIATLCAMPDSIYIIEEFSVNKSKPEGYDGMLCAWNHDSPNNKKSYELYYNMFHIVTFGNYWMHENLLKKDRNIPMRGVLNCIE